MELNQRAVLMASIAGILAATGAALTSSTAHAETEGAVHCYGINKCQGAGECGGKGHSCAGKNGCEGQGYLDLAEETCLKIKGGRLTVDEEPTLHEDHAH